MIAGTCTMCGRTALIPCSHVVGWTTRHDAATGRTVHELLWRCWQGHLQREVVEGPGAGGASSKSDPGPGGRRASA